MPFFSWFRDEAPDRIKPEDLREHMVWLRDRGISARRVARVMSSIRGFFRYLVEEEILEAEDPRLLRLAKPDHWPEQAALAASGDWEAFEALQAELKGGVK